VRARHRQGRARVTWQFHFSGPVTITGLSDAQHADLRSLLVSISGKVDHVLMDEALVKSSLDKIDAATTKAAGNIQILADTDQAISNEFDALNAALAAALANGTGVTQALVDQAAALGSKSQGVSDALDAMVPALQAIASKGVSNPVPVAIPASPAI
jgi:hypothetical protein